MQLVLCAGSMISRYDTEQENQEQEEPSKLHHILVRGEQK